MKLKEDKPVLPVLMAFQDQICDNLCFGCGPSNPIGLRIKSYWSGERESVCTYVPEKHHNAGPDVYVNGGIIATIIDCHAVCITIADAYRREGREIGTGENTWFATGSLSVKYIRPTPIDTPVLLKAQISETGDRKTVVKCSAFSDGIECASAEVVAVRESKEWRKG